MGSKFWQRVGAAFGGALFRGAANTAAPIPGPPKLSADELRGLGVQQYEHAPGISLEDIAQDIVKDAATSLAEQALFAMVRRALDELPNLEKQLEVCATVADYLDDYSSSLQLAISLREERVALAERAFTEASNGTAGNAE